MKQEQNVKERILRATCELIEAENGEVQRVTARRIAARANVGLGLINYYFGSKDALITACVQRIIGDVVAGFRLEQDYPTDQSRLTACATSVFEFLFAHPTVSRISILGDFQHPAADSNTARSQHGFQSALTSDIPPSRRALLSFVLTAAMQAAFLARAFGQSATGFDLSDPAGRAEFISELVAMLCKGGDRA